MHARTAIAARQAYEMQAYEIPANSQLTSVFQRQMLIKGGVLLFAFNDITGQVPTGGDFISTFIQLGKVMPGVIGDEAFGVLVEETIKHFQGDKVTLGLLV